MGTEPLPMEHPHASACENCGASLLGEYCHSCGQHAHNPLKSVKHALEEVFESFWHVDGRIFRTLRDICIPGRAAINYLSGKRARYLPPLRIFLILSIFTFFLAHLAMPEDTAFRVRDDSSFNEAKTVAEVEKMRADTLAAMAEVPEPAKSISIDKIGEAADARIAQLTGKTPQQASNSFNVSMQTNIEKEIAKARANPYRSAHMPDWYDALIQKLKLRMLSNIAKLSKGQDGLGPLWLSSVPTALFFMVPVFALLLRIIYWRSTYTYLEQLVVALYSHAHLLMLSALLLLGACLVHWTGSAALQKFVGFAFVPVVLWAMVYLYLSQKRIYRQSTLITTLKYLVLGSLHFMLLVFVATAAGIMMFLK